MYTTVKLTKKMALDFDLFNYIPNFMGCTFLNARCETYWCPKNEHNPRFEINLTILNLEIFSVAFYKY